MSNTALSLRIRRLRRRFGIAAPRVAVKSDIGRAWYVVGAFAIVVGLAMAAWFWGRQAEEVRLLSEVQGLRQQLAENQSEVRRLREGAAAEQSAVQMERSAQQQLVARIKVLERENASLKEDVSVLERLVKQCARGAEKK